MPGINGAKHLCITNNTCWVILIALMFVILIWIVAMRVVMLIVVLVNCRAARIVAALQPGCEEMEGE